MKPKKTKSYPKLKKELDAIYSKYIRMIHADVNGNVRCITCGKVLPWKEAQCCHWISRNHLSTRWDFRNTNPGCVGCNVFGSGKLDEYAIWLIKNYGEGVLEELNALKHTTVKYSKSDLEQKIAEYKQKVEILEKR